MMIKRARTSSCQSKSVLMIEIVRSKLLKHIAKNDLLPWIPWYIKIIFLSFCLWPCVLNEDLPLPEQPFEVTFKATTNVKMHHLRFSDMKLIEEENPTLRLQLHKIVSYLVARREEDIIAHSSTLHSILSSPAVDFLSRQRRR